MLARLMRGCFLVLAIGLATWLLLPRGGKSVAQTPTDKKPAASEDKDFFEKEVAPILAANCLECHNADKAKGKLAFTNRASLLKGGRQGPALSLDKPEESLLLSVVSHEDVLKMPPPPQTKLPQKEIDILTRWVKSGAAWPDGVVIKAVPPKERIITVAERNYWAYRPVKRSDIPAVKQKNWVHNPVDAFILAQLEEKGLTPAEPADRRALIRRATYDLTGLPPTPEEIDAFVKDKAADSYEKLLDKLLDSPAYGEKWGRHWLDLVRYAETNGYERDNPKPFAWRYRDYVIKSFNDDKPYDRFLKEQLAGDELPGSNSEALIALGYYRLGLWDDEPADPELARYDEFDDLVTTTGQVFLGMTLNCARCHDHKIDPILQKDYYQILAFFRDVPRYSNVDKPGPNSSVVDLSARLAEELKQRDARLVELEGLTRTIENAAIKKMSAEDQRECEGPLRERVLSLRLKNYLTPEQVEEYTKLKNELTALKKAAEPNRAVALSVCNCIVHPPATTVMIRGNAHSPGAKVEPGFPSVLNLPVPTISQADKGAKTSGRRTVLANWIASKENPLTARVLVNRLWQHHFGRGLVATTNDFGKFGTPPTHPELLDWLAVDFMAGDWKIKRMHKLLMMSSAYQMSAKASDAGLKLDPSNALLWRFNMRRLTAEEVRDSMLAVSGKLNLKMGGPSVYPPIPKEVLAGQSVPGQGWPVSKPEEASRRSVYVHVKRSLLVPILTQHDQADTDSTCAVRYTTTVPTQALGMLNGQFSNEQAAALAERLRKELPDKLDAQVSQAIRLTTGRKPMAEEVKKDAAFIKMLQEKNKLSDQDALRCYCLLVLNANEFVYSD
jgi:mono/diheme cytochrome c family protein